MWEPALTSNVRRILFFLAIALLALHIGGAWFYRAQETLLQQRVESELTAVAQLKTTQIAVWRARRLAEAAELLARPLLRSRIMAWLAEPTGNADDILAEFRVLQEFDDYRKITLVDPQGRVALNAPDGLSADNPVIAAALQLCFRERRPVLTDLYVDSAQEETHIAVVAPVFAADRTLGAVLLIGDARTYLYPLIRNWPTTSRTAETLLVERDGDTILFLNELRHRSGGALTFRLPADDLSLPAALAVGGTTGVVRGRDYRGIEVLAAVQRVPDSPWFIVSKIDRDEASSAWRARSGSILAVLVATAAAIVAAGLLAWQTGRRVHLQALFEAERTRRLGEERHHATLRSIGDGVIATDAVGRVVLMNPVAEAFTGWSSDEAKGRPLEDVLRLIDEETRHMIATPVERVLRGGTVVGLAKHTLLVARDGVERPIADSGAPIRDDAGQITGVVLVFRDQTKDRAAQRALRNSAVLHQSTVAALTEGVVVFDTAGMILSCNPAAEQIIGVTWKEMMERAAGLTTWAPLLPDGSSCPPEERPITRTLATGESCRGVELGYVGPDGRLAWLLVNSEPLRDPETRRLMAVVASITDITARKAGEKALRESEERFRNAVETAPDAIFVQANGRFAYLNDAALTLFGAEHSEELVGAPVLERFHPDHRADFCARIDRLNTDRAAVPLAEETGLRLDGSPVDLEVSAVPFTFGPDAGALVFARDVTERRRAETERVKLQNELLQAQKMDSVGRLAGGVAHDFNNMLGVIIGHAELALMQTPQSDPNRDHLQIIQTAAERSADLTRQLLAFARKQTIAPKLLDLNVTIPDTLKMLRRLIGENIGIDWHPGDDVWPVLLDPTQVDQILANLAVNARDAIGGAGTIMIETRNVTFNEVDCAQHAGFSPGPFVMMAVSDNGAGMDRATIDQLFEPFFTTKSLGQGTGLGLSTVYGIVKQNGGFINVYSEPEKGTTFKIYLPRADRPSAAAGSVPAMAAPQSSGEVVLLVEDEPALLAMSQKLLVGLGYTVLTSDSPSGAILFVESHAGEIDLLVTDVVMPGFNGRVLAKRLRTIKPGLKCLFMSGYTPDAIAHGGILEDGVHFLQKPFTRQDLALKVREALETS
jgi:two-component system cell cycle sensor histidine kinase/response regulator CckA